MTLRTLLKTAPVLSALALAACSGGKSSGGGAPSVKKEGPVVASVGGDVITKSEVEKKLGEQSPFLQTRYKDLGHRKEFVQNMVRFEVLAQEAYRRGLDKDPEVYATLKKVLVQELIKREFDDKQAKFSDEELKAYYDKHIDEYVKPERVRASQIFLAAPESDKAARAAARKKAGEMLAQLKGDKSPTLFADLARKESNDVATQASGGDMRYLSRADLAKQYSDKFADAVFDLKEANDMTSIIEDDKGVRIARMTNRQPAMNRPFEDPTVKEQIRSRKFREERTKSFDEYVAKLKEEAKVNIDEAVLGSVEIPNAAPSAAGVPSFAAPTGMPPAPAGAPAPAAPSANKAP